jgi:cytochrome c oxidase subunit III
MNLGTVEPLKTETILEKRRGRTSGRSGGTGGRNGSNGGGGNGRDPHSDGDDSISKPRAVDKSRVLTAFLLLAVMMTFGGLIGAYVVVATNGVAEWRPFSLPIQVWISTAIILASSFTYHTAKVAIDLENTLKARNWLIATTVLGAAFISSQLLVWMALVSRGYYMSGNPYAGFFYILTAVHALHVTGGIIALGSILLRAWQPTLESAEADHRRNLARAVGWYWHFMGGLWVVLLVLLGYWK